MEPLSISWIACAVDTLAFAAVFGITQTTSNKKKKQTVDHLFLHCPVALELWDMVFGLFGVYWVMPMSVVGLFACWQC